MPEFRRLNPNGKVPVLVDPDGPEGRSIVLFESGAILIYLSEKTGALMPTDALARHEVIQWLMLQMSGIGPMGGQAIHFGVLAKDAGYARNRFDIEIERLLDVVETWLSQLPYLGGESYTIADVALIPWIRTLRRFRPRLEERTALIRWFDSVGQRPAVVRAFAAADRLSAGDRELMGKASKEMLDRYFGRVAHTVAVSDP